MKKNNSKNWLDLFETINKLKETKRTGWIRVGVNNPESVAEHSFRMAVMAFFLAKKLKCNQEKLVKMCLVHDLHESISGDLILDYTRHGSSNYAGLPLEEKKEKEKKAFNELKKIIGKDSKEFEKLWLEFEVQKTKEAKIAKELDALEMLLQAAEYTKTGNFEKPIWPMWISENGPRVKNPVLKKILEEAGKGFWL